MGATKIADVIVPEIFNPYVSMRAMELSALFQSGIISNNPELDRLALAGGKTINMPFWEDLTGEDENLTDSGALTPDKIGSDKDVAVLLMRGKAWGVNDLAAALAGDDPMKEIADKVATWWARRDQVILLAILKGLFIAGGTLTASHLLDISGEAGAAANIDADAFLDATNKMGDAAKLLTAVAMHSNTKNYLRKQNLIATVKPSEGGEFEVYNDRRVIVDDTMPVAAGVYDTYLFGQGAIGLGRGAAKVPTETDRDSLAGEDILINRRHFILHPRGVAWTGADQAGAPGPTNVDLAKAANWSKVYENKAVRIVCLRHKIG